MSTMAITEKRGAGGRILTIFFHPMVWLVFLFLVTSTQVNAVNPFAQALAIPGYLVILVLDLFEMAIVPLSGFFWPAVVVLSYAIAVALVAIYETIR